MTSIGTNSAQVTLSGRELALQRRQAMALRGKAGVAKLGGVRASAAAVSRPAMSSTPARAHAPAPAVATHSAHPQSPPPNAARQRRQALSQTGKRALGATTTATRPVGQVRPAFVAAGAASTLAASVMPTDATDCGCGCKGSGACAVGAAPTPMALGGEVGFQQATEQTLSGRDVAKQRRAARAMVGRHDASSSAPSPSGRMRAQHASLPAQAQGPVAAPHAGPAAADGTQHKVTGTQAGGCESVTGTAFLSLDQFTSISGKKSTSHPSTARSVSVMSSNNAPKASGLEDRPSKVASVHTLAGSLVTGTEVGRSPKVTGDDRGGCRAVTGTDYISTQQLQGVCENTVAVQPVRKVGQDRTWNDQSITGARVGRSQRVTGDEYGGCAPISGTSYIGTQQYQGFCEPEQIKAQQALSRREGFIAASVVTGDRAGTAASSARFVRPERPAKAENTSPTASDFSIRPPSRQARDRSSNAVTGSAFSGQRITGAANKGLGLITGTPEFRHRDNTPAFAPPAAPDSRAATGSSKLTGEGSQAGVQISGAAWQTSSRVTGTEGASTLTRNPSQRGDVREMGMTAKNFRKTERAEPPQSKVTGSSGNTASGVCVTLSGGARG